MHRHFGYKGRKLSRKAGPRKALLRGLASQVILHEEITTTLEKAKEIRPIVEKLITKAKKGTMTDQRTAGKFLSNNDKALDKLFRELGPLYKERAGGYLRILRLGARKGDSAEMARVSLLDTEKLTKKEIEKTKEAKPKKVTTEKVVAKETKVEAKKKTTKATGGAK